MIDEKRGTGRTTRMLKRAIDLRNQGRAVYVIAANEQHAETIFGMLIGLMPEETPVRFSSMEIGGIKIETPESCGNFDWEQLRLRGSHPNVVALVDHHAIESRFSLMLKELAAYDTPPHEENDE